MKSILKIVLLSLASTLAILIVIIAIGLLFVPEIGVHISYPIRVLRGTERYVGETRGIEVLFIWERIIIPFIFLSSATVFYYLRKKLRFIK